MWGWGRETMPSSKSATLLGGRRSCCGRRWRVYDRSAGPYRLPDHGHRLCHRRRGRRCWRCYAGRAALACGRRRRPSRSASYGLFGYHALYFAALKLAPPAEAHLIASLWALLTVLFSGLLPGARLRPATSLAAFLGLAAATMLVWDKLGRARGADTSGWASRWRSPARSFGRAIPWPRACSPPCRARASPSPVSATSALAFVCSLAFENGPRRPIAPPGWRCWAWAWARSAPPSCCGTSA